MVKQVETIKELIDFTPLGVGSHLSQYGFAHFGIRNDFVVPINVTQMSSLGTSKTSLDSAFDFLLDRSNRVKFSDHRKIFGEIIDEMASIIPSPLDPVAPLPTKAIVITGDGKPVHKPRKGTIKRECKAAAQAKANHPGLKVVCLNAEKKKRQTPFYRCACDSVIQNNNPDIASRLIMGSMCSIDCNLRLSDPCAARTTKKTCKKFKRNYLGMPGAPVPDPVGAIEFEHCFWSKRKCLVRGEVKHLYKC